MKKIAAGIAAAALIVTIGGISVFAAGYGRQGSGSCTWGSQCAYTDSDGDGICDNRAAACSGTDTCGYGTCDNTQAGCNYTDSDGDGICDNRETGCENDGNRICPQDGTGNKFCRGKGCGR